MTIVLDLEQSSCSTGASEGEDRAFTRQLLGGFGDFHRPQCRQDFLAGQAFLALRTAGPHEKLAGMSIHKVIKARRLELGLSHAALAALITDLEKPKKALGRQTIQHWEKEPGTKGSTAPKRTRMKHVATALQLTLEEFLARANETPLGGGDLLPDEKKLVDSLREIRSASPNGYAHVMAAIKHTLAAHMSARPDAHMTDDGQMDLSEEEADVAVQAMADAAARRPTEPEEDPPSAGEKRPDGPPSQAPRPGGRKTSAPARPSKK